MAADGIAVVTVPDIRWQRVDIKSVALLPNVLAKQTARDSGAREAWLVDAQGRVTEGASSNAWIVSRDGKLITRPLGRDILPGITRSVVLDVVGAAGAGVSKNAPSRSTEAYAAREAFVTSASQTVLPVVSIDGRAGRQWRAGAGRRRALRREYHRHAEIGSFRALRAVASIPPASKNAPPEPSNAPAGPRNTSYFSGLMGRSSNLCLRRERACHLIATS